MPDNRSSDNPITPGQVPSASSGYFLQADRIPDEISLIDIVRALVRFRWTLLITTATITVIAVIAALIITPIYRAEVLMISVDNESMGELSGLAGQIGGLSSLVGLDLSGNQGIIVEGVATLNSREFTVDFIEEQNLLPVLFAEEWDEDNGDWITSNPDEVPTLQDGFRLFDTLRFVNEDPGSGLVTLAIEWTDREMAANWANLLADRVNRLLRQRAIEQAEKSLDYLRKELETTNKVEIQQAIYRLIEKSISEIMLANVREEYAFRIVDPAAVLEEEDRIWPKRKLIVFMGLLLGLFMGALLALLRNFLSPD